MRVAITSIYNRHCGIGQYTEHLSRQLHADETAVVTYRKDDAKEAPFVSYPYRSLKSLQYHVAPFYLKKAIKNESADIWHADHVSSFLALDWHRAKQPKIVTAHDAIPFHHGQRGVDFQIYKYQLRRSLKGAKYVIVVSESARRDLIQQTSMNPDQVVAIPNGINAKDYSPELKMSDNNLFTIRYLGGLGAAHKNVAMLLHTAKFLEDLGVPFTMELAGYLPERHALRALRSRLGLHSVRFPGFIPDNEKAAFLAQADLFAYPSLLEGFGFPPMEAMASGTPVIASDIPVFRELLGDEALLLEPRPQAFARGIQQMIGSRSMRQEFSARGLQQVKKYTWERTANQTLDLYQKALMS